jgi:hypothetical protein
MAIAVPDRFWIGDALGEFSRLGPEKTRSLLPRFVIRDRGRCVDFVAKFGSANDVLDLREQLARYSALNRLLLYKLILLNWLSPMIRFITYRQKDSGKSWKFPCRL